MVTGHAEHLSKLTRAKKATIGALRVRLGGRCNCISKSRLCAGSFLFITFKKNDGQVNSKRKGVAFALVHLGPVKDQNCRLETRRAVGIAAAMLTEGKQPGSTAVTLPQAIQQNWLHLAIGGNCWVVRLDCPQCQYVAIYIVHCAWNTIRRLKIEEARSSSRTLNAFP